MEKDIRNSNNSAPAETPKKRGRPLGSKNKPKVEAPKKRGRPLGSKNKKSRPVETVASAMAEVTHKKRGRPLGSKNKKSQLVETVASAQTEITHKKRGRPRVKDYLVLDRNCAVLPDSERTSFIPLTVSGNKNLIRSNVPLPVRRFVLPSTGIVEEVDPAIVVIADAFTKTLGSPVPLNKKALSGRFYNWLCSPDNPVENDRQLGKVIDLLNASNKKYQREILKDHRIVITGSEFNLAVRNRQKKTSRPAPEMHQKKPVYTFDY